ncbi:MAG: hypothetical protein ACE5RN_03865 [Nitrosopumilaceae archaeon]
MSDEFLKVATQEINDEIASIKKILKNCKNDSDISKNSLVIEGHIHKIKGLSPMMGKPAIGVLAEITDSLLNHVIEGKNIDGIFSVLIEVSAFMSDSMNGNEKKLDEIKQNMETKYSKYLD